MDKGQIVRSIAAERRRTLGLLRPLEPSRWDTPTALPRWRIREIVAHLITTDSAVVTGRFLPLALRRSTDPLEAWNERQVPKWADRTTAELLDGLERWGRRFVTLARATGPLYRLPLPASTWGREPLGMVVWIRAFDEWVHRQDLRRALGMQDEGVDLADVAEFVLRAIGCDLPRWPPGPAGAVSVSLQGPPVPEWGYDAATRRAAPELAQGAAVRISARAPGFIMATAGRGSFEDLRSTGALTAEGDDTLAAWFLENVRIV